MADEIKQVFGFEASQALAVLSQLDNGFAKLSQTVTQSAASFSNFNNGAARIVDGLSSIVSQANAAAQALGKLQGIKSPTVAAVSAPTTPAAAAQVNALLAQTTSQATTAAAALGKMGSQGTSALNQMTRSANGFALSLETTTRVIGTQVIVRALNSIRSAVDDSFQGFIGPCKRSCVSQRKRDSLIALS